MSQFLILLGSVVGTWLLHAVLVTTYSRQFTDTFTAVFRAVYALELALVFSVMLLLYLSKVTNPASLAMIVLTTIGFLAIVDTALWVSQQSVRSTFDIYHFAVAYAVTAVTMIITYFCWAKI